MYFVKTPEMLQPLTSDLMWSVHTFEKEVFLTFDDGPIPSITEEVLDILKKYNAKATFFCIGKNVAAHPAIYQRILQEGHKTGNHTQDHLNGTKTKHFTYLKNVSDAATKIQSNLFRPPYGRITPAQVTALKNRYTIVMWDIITGDFDKKITVDKVVKNVLNNVKEGSIIVFHDSLKAAPRMLPALQIVMAELAQAGFKFSVLPTK